MDPATSESESVYRRLIGREFAPQELPSLIETAFTSKGYTTRRFLGDDAQTFIDVLDEALNRADLSPSTQKKCLKLLYRTCGRHALLPRSLKISIHYNRVGAASYRGGFADVWKGEHCGRDVAIKIIRTYSNADLQKIIGRFCKEAVIWKTLQHPNVLPLIGVTVSENQFAMVSDWMVNGNINEFVRARPDANLLGLLGDVTRGLIYIHNRGMVHGDIKGRNILIDQTGHARLADFGLLTVISEPANPLSSNSYTEGGTARWMSPELIAPRDFGFENRRPTKSSDCYALGMVIYETISGNLPFHEHADLEVILNVPRGGRPSRGVRFADSLWGMLEQCWAPQPTNRPDIDDIRLCLETFLNSSEPPYLEVDEEMDEGDGDWDSTNSFSDGQNSGAYPGDLGREATDPNLLISRIDSNSGGSYLRPPAVFEANGVVGRPDLSTQNTDSGHPPNVQGSGTTILDRVPDAVYLLLWELVPLAALEGWGLGGRSLDNLGGYVSNPQRTVISQETADQIHEHLTGNITRRVPGPQKLLRIPQRSYCQGTAIPEGARGQMIMFATTGGGYFPAELALAGQYNLLVDAGGAVFTEQNHTINLRIEWPGYDGWGAQIRIVNYQEEPKPITRAKLVKEIAKQLERFIERMKSADIDPSYAEYKVGPGGIELRHVLVDSLEQVSRGSWQPQFIYSG